jgi:hypothetical protein
MRREIDVPFATDEPGPGVSEEIRPGMIEAAYSPPATTTVKPAAWSCAFASDNVIPTTDGTAIAVEVGARCDEPTVRVRARTTAAAASATARATQIQSRRRDFRKLPPATDVMAK